MDKKIDFFVKFDVLEFSGSMSEFKLYFDWLFILLMH